MSNSIYVVGSANVDYVTRVQRLPHAGETVAGEDLLMAFGGKGANQAVAAARLGGRVCFLGCFGSDDAGHRYREHLSTEGVDIALSASSERPNGCALIAVDAIGANTIVVSPGANQDLLPQHAESLRRNLQTGDLVLLQCEIPMETNVAAARIAHECGAILMFNPSPYQSFEAIRDEGIGVLVLNEHEAQLVLEMTEDNENFADRLTELASGMAEAVVVTRGAEPAWLITRDHFEEFPSATVTPIDTVGAGDTFTGALAVALSEGASLSEAMAFAQQAAGLAILGLGAQTAMPHRQDMV